MTAFDPSDARSVDAHRRLYRSPSWRARFGLAMLHRSRAACAITQRLRPVPESTAERFHDLGKQLADFVPGGVTAIALNSTAGLERAIVATVDDSGLVTFTKAQREHEERLADQVDVIGSFQRVCPDCIVVPEVRAFGRAGDWTALSVTDVGCSGSWCTPTFDQVLPLSARLAHPEDSAVGLRELVDLADPVALEALPKARALAERIVEDGRPGGVRVGVAHGDFVPWNMELDEAGRLRLWDWDHSMPLAPWPYDAIHFSIQQRRHWLGEDSARAWEATAATLANHANELGLSADPSDVRGLMRLYALWRATNQYRLNPADPDADWLLELALGR